MDRLFIVQMCFSNSTFRVVSLDLAADAAAAVAVMMIPVLCLWLTDRVLVDVSVLNGWGLVSGVYSECT